MFSFGSSDGENTTNAYMCFYERSYKTKVNLVANTAQHKKDIVEAIGFKPLELESDSSEEETIETKETKETEITEEK